MQIRQPRRLLLLTLLTLLPATALPLPLCGSVQLCAFWWRGAFAVSVLLVGQYLLFQVVCLVLQSHSSAPYHRYQALLDVLHVAHTTGSGLCADGEAACRLLFADGCEWLGWLALVVAVVVAVGLQALTYAFRCVYGAFCFLFRSLGRLLSSALCILCVFEASAASSHAALINARRHLPTAAAVVDRLASV